MTDRSPDPVVEAYKKDVDRTLLRENLKLTVEERIRKLMELQRFFEAVRQAGREAKGRAQSLGPRNRAGRWQLRRHTRRGRCKVGPAPGRS